MKDESILIVDKVASVWLRWLAWLIDLLLLGLFYQFFFLGVVSARTVTGLFDALLNLVIGGFLLIPLAYPFLNSFLISQFGGTLGKLLTGTKIVDVEGEKISFKRAFWRNFLGYLVSGMFFWAGFIWMAKDKKRRGWHDMMANTLVVVSSRLGAMTGILILALVLLGNIFLGLRSYQLIVQNLPFYQSLVQ